MIAHAGYTVAAYRALDGGTARKEARGKMEKERLIKAADRIAGPNFSGTALAQWLGACKARSHTLCVAFPLSCISLCFALH